MIPARIYQRKPSSGAQHPRRFGEVLRRKHANNQIDRGILHRPLRPQVDDNKCERRPSPCSLPRCLSGNIEAKADNGGREGVGYSRKVMSSARARIQSVPPPQSGLRIALPNVFRDRRRDPFEMTSIEKSSAMPQLPGAVATRSRSASPMAQKIDVAFAG